MKKHPTTEKFELCVVKILIFGVMIGLVLLFLSPFFYESSSQKQFKMERELHRARVQEEQTLRRMYDPTPKEMREDIRRAAKQAHPDNLKKQVILERNLKDFYGVE